MKTLTVFVQQVLIPVMFFVGFFMGVRFGQDFKRIDDRKEPKGWKVQSFSINREGPLCLRLGNRGENDDGFTPVFQSGFCPKDAPVYWQPRPMKEPVEEGK